MFRSNGIAMAMLIVASVTGHRREDVVAQQIAERQRPVTRRLQCAEGLVFSRN
jgi:hypothetical protein